MCLVVPTSTRVAAILPRGEPTTLRASQVASASSCLPGNNSYKTTF